MKQSTYGDGTLYQRKDGRWEYRVRIGEKASGDPDYKSFYSRDKTGRKAKEQYKLWLAERDKEKVETVQTVAQWARTWLRDYKKGRGSAGNYKNYEVYVEKHIIPHIGAMLMSDVRQVHIERIYAAESDLSNSALNYIKICLRGIFKTGRKNHLCTEDPTEDTKPIEHDKKPPEYYTKEEVGRILAFAEQDPDGYLAKGLLYTGMRIGELCALTWADYDGSALTVRQAAARTREKGSKYDLKDGPKNKKVRSVVLDPAGKQFFDKLEKKSVFIFPAPTGGFMSPDRYRRHFYYFIDRLNLQLAEDWVKSKKKGTAPTVRKLSPHKCRHTYGTHLLSGCKNLRTVQDQLGHSRITTTEIYTHTDLQSRQKDVKKLGY